MPNRLVMNPLTLVLARGELAVLRLGGRKCRISCLAGRAWVTVSNSHEDWLLAPGNEASFAGRGTIVVEALRTATVRLEIDATARENVRLGRMTLGKKQECGKPLSAMPEGTLAASTERAQWKTSPPLRGRLPA